MKKLAVSLVCVIVLLVFVMPVLTFAAIDHQFYFSELRKHKEQLLQLYNEMNIKSFDDFFNYIESTNPPIEKARYAIIDGSSFTRWKDANTKQWVAASPFFLYLLEKRTKGQLTDVYVAMSKEVVFASLSKYKKKMKEFRDEFLVKAQRYNISVYEISDHVITHVFFNNLSNLRALGLTDQQIEENDIVVIAKRHLYHDSVELESKFLTRYTEATLADAYRKLYDKAFEWIENEEQIYKKIKEAKKQ